MAAWDIEIDCEGLLCPLPVLRARKRLLALAPGTVVCDRATDAMALVDLPHFCAEGGHELVSVEPSEPGARAFTVRPAAPARMKSRRKRRCGSERRPNPD